jgi:hypothetical protein
LTELQDAFAVFVSGVLQDKTLTAAVDGKTNKQMLDKGGDVLQILNVFVLFSVLSGRKSTVMGRSLVKYIII